MEMGVVLGPAISEHIERYDDENDRDGDEHDDTRSTEHDFMMGSFHDDRVDAENIKITNASLETIGEQTGASIDCAALSITRSSFGWMLISFSAGVFADNFFGAKKNQVECEGLDVCALALGVQIVIGSTFFVFGCRSGERRLSACGNNLPMNGRLRIVRALGSMHEFMTGSNKKSVDDGNEVISKQILQRMCLRGKSNATTEKLGGFAEANTDFLQCIDRAMKALRVGAGLHVGIGPASNCVARVEDALVAREYRKLKVEVESVDKTARLSAPLGLQRVRFVLQKGMLEQHELLREILKAVSIGSGEDLLPVPLLPSSRPLTISVLTAMRKELGDLLEEVLSVILVANPNFHDSISPRALDSLSVRTKEREACILAYFPGSNLERLYESEQRKRSDGTPQQRKYLKLIRQRIDAAVVSLWAYEMDANYVPIGDEENCSLEVEASCAGKNMEKWWVRAQDGLMESIKYWNEFDSLIRPSKAPASAGYRSSANHGDSNPVARASESVDTFEHSSGEEIPSPIKNESQPDGKIIIFSGKARQRDEGRGTETWLEELSSKPQRAHLLHELKGRIDAMDFGEEWDANQDDDSDSESNSDSVNEARNMNTAPPLFLGASGSLLSELKASINQGTIIKEETLLDD